MIIPKRTRKRLFPDFRLLTTAHIPRALKSSMRLRSSKTVLYHTTAGAKLKVRAETRPVNRSKISLDILYNTGTVRIEGTTDASDNAGRPMPKVRIEIAIK